MRVFLHEFITSGALTGEPLPASLLTEGAAMRRAVAEDLLTLPRVQVVTTRDHRVPPSDITRMLEIEVTDRGSEQDLFRTHCAGSDRCLIIAPEIGGELRRRVSLACELAGADRLLNSPALVPVASDKWETYLRLRAAGIPTIETRLGSSAGRQNWDDVVIKPRDGAGSQGIRRLLSDSGSPGDHSSFSDSIVMQPFVDGRWLSCTALFRPGGAYDLFPPAAQRMADDGSFAYLGGSMPADCDVAKVQSLVLRAIRAVAGPEASLVGPVGVDLVEQKSTGELLICEINPRFTTSVIAARRLAEGGLLAGLIAPDAPPIRWTSGRVAFDSAGNVLKSAL